MRSRLIIPSLVTSTLLLAGVASAQSKDTKDAAKPASTGTTRKDPEGKSGISPYMEAIVKGEKQFVGGDASAAIASFQEATKLDAEKMLAFYRLGEAQIAAGKLEDADASFQAALGKKGNDDLHAKVLFVIADLRERQGKWQAAKDAWSAYSAYLQNNPRARGYPASAVDRQKMADRRMKDEVDYGKVKERIEKRRVEVEKEAEENAKKDKLNR
jgi:tetratricopeptide (TPR) repeat protein